MVGGDRRGAQLSSRGRAGRPTSSTPPPVLSLPSGLSRTGQPQGRMHCAVSTVSPAAPAGLSVRISGTPVYGHCAASIVHSRTPGQPRQAALSCPLFFYLAKKSAAGQGSIQSDPNRIWNLRLLSHLLSSRRFRSTRPVVKSESL